MKTGKGKKHLFAAPFGLLFLIALNLLAVFRFSYEWALYDIVNAIQCFPPFWVIPLLLIFLPQILILRSARKNTRLFAAELVLCVSALVIWFGPLPRLVNFALYRAQREEICENWDKWEGAPAVCAPCGRYRDETRGVSIQWMSPDEWLVVVAAGREFATENRLREALSGHYAVMNVSGRISQCRGRPIRCCQISTDSPNAPA